MEHDERLEHLAFDFYERYILLNTIGKLFRPEGLPYLILDVGGDTPAFWPDFPSMAGALIPDASVFVADVHTRSELRDYVRTSGFRLPFSDGSFDLVCSLDTLEHVPADRRPEFLRELLRVTRDGLYIAFPFDSPSNRWAENILVEFTGVTLRSPLRNLLEHREFGLPDPAAVHALLSGASYPLVQFQQGNTDVWLLMMLTYHTLRFAGEDFVHELNRRFNRTYAAQDWDPPAYRTGYVLSKKKSLTQLQALSNDFRKPAAAGRLELNSVLSFCQLYLQLAHQGRALVDKDRHIQNIEGELAATKPYQAKWEQVVALLRRLETDILQMPVPLAGQDTAEDWLPERASRVVEEAYRFTDKLKSAAAERDLLQRKIAELGAQLALKDTELETLRIQSKQEQSSLLGKLGSSEQEVLELNRNIAQLEQHIKTLNEVAQSLSADRDQMRRDLQEIGAKLTSVNSQLDETGEKAAGQALDLQQLRALQTQFGFAVRNLKSDLVGFDQRVSQIYDSRIWKTLVTCAAIVEQLPGVRRILGRDHSRLGADSNWVPLLPSAAEDAEKPPPSPAGLPSPPLAATWNLRHALDEPVDGQEFGFGEAVVRGWAIPETGQLSVSARLSDLPWTPLSYGRSRHDVAHAFPDCPQAEYSGFYARIDTSALPEGTYPFRLRIAATSGESLEISRTVRIIPPADGLHPSREAVRLAPEDHMRLKIEAPMHSAPLFCGSILRVQGWAVAQKGIDQVLVWLEDDGPHSATFGFLREDIHHLYEDFPDSEHSGFSWYGSTALLNPGACRIRVRATSKAGHSVEAWAEFQIDSRTAYEFWADLNTPSSEDLKHIVEECAGFAYSPKISIVTPVYRTREDFLKKCIDSVRRQAYPTWELILVDDASGEPRLTALLESYAARDPRIRLQTLPVNQGIAGATNAGIAMSAGEYIALLDHDDEISPDALYHAVRTLNEDPSLDVLYSDEDKIDPQGKRVAGFFKPDWSPDLLGSMNYICHFLVCRKSLVEAIGGLKLGFDGSQDYDLILRLTERTGNIRRIPKVLYHWRMHSQSTAMLCEQKPKASEAGLRALEEHLERIGLPGEVQEVGPCRYRIRYPIRGTPEVSIIIPTGGNDKFRLALRSVLQKTSYQNYRIVVVDNSSTGDVRHWVREHEGGSRRIDRLDCQRQPFNFSFLCNRGAAHTSSPYLLFLNDDTSVITQDWLEAMLEHAQRPEVGAVGAQLLFPNDTIQHAGVVMGLVGVAAHVFRGLPANKPHYFALSQVIRNYSAVTGACLLSRRDAFSEVGGFDESHLPTCFQDIDLCLKLLDAGHRVVYTPYAQLYHYESATKKSIARPNEIRYMEDRWKRFIQNDPFYNPNLSRQSDGYDLAFTDVVVCQQDG